MRFHPRLTITLLLSVALSGCATLPRLSPDEAEARQRHHEARLGDLQDWRITGKISVRDEEDAFSGRVLWERTPERFELVLLAPMGRGTWRLEGREGTVVLIDDEQHEWRGSDAGELLSRRMGWRVPVEAMQDWVRGLRPPDGEFELDAWGRLTRISEDGWTVRYQAWQESHGLQLPRTLVATRAPYRLKLTIHEWVFPQLEDSG